MANRAVKVCGFGRRRGGNRDVNCPGVCSILISADERGAGITLSRSVVVVAITAFHFDDMQ